MMSRSIVLLITSAISAKPIVDYGCDEFGRFAVNTESKEHGLVEKMRYLTE